VGLSRTRRPAARSDNRAVPEFLVERYVARLDEAALEAIVERLTTAAADLAADGRHVRRLRSIALFEDETCLCLFEAACADDVLAVNMRARVPYERVSEACSIG
jgi:hypothetical protein